MNSATDVFILIFLHETSLLGYINYALYSVSSHPSSVIYIKHTTCNTCYVFFLVLRFWASVTLPMLAMSTRSSAIAEEPRDASCQLKSC